MADTITSPIKSSRQNYKDSETFKQVTSTEVKSDNMLNESPSHLTDSIQNKAQIGFGKSPRSKPTRRSLSGAPLTYLFETKFQHFKAFQKTQNEAKGLNFLLAPVSGALYRSSVPATPIATPLFNMGLRFTEQTLRERMRLHLLQTARNNIYDEPDIKEVRESHLDLTSTEPESTSLDNRLTTEQDSTPKLMEVDGNRANKESVSSDRSSDNSNKTSSSKTVAEDIDDQPQFSPSKSSVPDKPPKSSRNQRKKNR